MKHEKLKVFKINATLLGTITGGNNTRNQNQSTEAPITDPNKELTEEEDAHSNAENS